MLEMSSPNSIAMNQPTPDPLILTLKLEQSMFEQVNSLRQQYFPPERNIVPAHVTLFHALPGDRQLDIEQQLQQLCRQTAKMTLQLSTLRFLGRGVAIDLHSPELVQLRQALAATWKEWLTPQDQQGYRPHITIQNKVSAAKARQVYEELKASWQAIDGYGEGLSLWYYRNGPWELAHELSFA